MKGNNKFAHPVSKSVPAVVDPVDQQRLNSFFKQELGFFNSVVGIFESRTRAFPKAVAAINSDQRKLFSEIAKSGLSIKSLIKTPNEWPEQLKDLKSVVWNKNGDMILTESFVMMLEEVVKDRWVISPETKKMLAMAMVEFFHDQADILSNPQNSDLIEIAYKTPPANISKQEFSVKRHVQIPITDVKFKWDHENNQSLISTPYNSKPIALPYFNLNEFNGWTTLILKQESGKFADFNTPWLAEFKNTGGKYLLKYNDVGVKKKQPQY